MHEKERKYIMNEQAFDMVWNEKAKDNREDIAFLDAGPDRGHCPH